MCFGVQCDGDASRDAEEDFERIPDKYRQYLRLDGECWVPSKHRAATYQPVVTTPTGKKTLRRVLWERSGRPDPGPRRLMPDCGNRDCHRPDHCRLGNGRTVDRAAYVRQYRRRVQKLYCGTWEAVGTVVASLERRGYREWTKYNRRSLLPINHYRVGPGRRGPTGKRKRTWIVYWREPLRAK